MFVPPQGFRHAATLLLTNSVRAVPGHASSDETCTALERLAHELVALAEDTRTTAEAADWLITEFATAVDRMPQAFDRDSAKSTGVSILARVGTRPREMDTRDLFLIYVPEDRLPVAAPLAIELAKRRVSVAFAEYEVASAAQLAAALMHGLACHRGGVVLHTKAFERARWPIPAVDKTRLRVLTEPDAASAAAELVEWVGQLRVSKI